jgi:hypothetical protein
MVEDVSPHDITLSLVLRGRRVWVVGQAIRQRPIGANGKHEFVTVRPFARSPRTPLARGPREGS